MSIPFAAAAEGYSGNLAKLETLAQTLSEARPAGVVGDYDVRMQTAAAEFCDHLQCVPLAEAEGSLRKAFFEAPYDQQQQILGAARAIAQKLGQNDLSDTFANNLVLARVLDESVEPDHKAEADDIERTIFVMLRTTSLTPYLKVMGDLSQHIPDEATGSSPFSDKQIDLLRSDFEKRLANCLGNPQAEMRHVQAFDALAFKLTHDEYYDAAKEALADKIAALDLASRQGSLNFKKG